MEVQGGETAANYDLKRLGNDERKRLKVEIDRLPADHVFVDIRPEFPGGEYPLKGSILLRNFNSIISFVARGIAEDAGHHVELDPRTGPVQRNTAYVLEIKESSSPLKDAESDVEFEGKYYSIWKFPISE